MRLGFGEQSVERQSECRRDQLLSMQKMEDKQLRMMIGICTLFIICHTSRILRNLEDLYLRLIKNISITDSQPCNESCASIFTLSSHVSFITNRTLTIWSIK